MHPVRVPRDSVPTNSISVRYDTIRDAILTCVQKLTQVSLIYRTEPTTEKCKNRKTRKEKTDMLRSIGKQSWDSMESVLEKKRKLYDGQDLPSRKVLSLE